MIKEIIREMSYPSATDKQINTKQVDTNASYPSRDYFALKSFTMDIASPLTIRPHTHKIIKSAPLNLQVSGSKLTQK